MYLDKGRSGTHNEHIGNHPDDWSGLSQNGRQFRSEITGQINNLSGADYWHMRKELPDKLSVSESIEWNSYPTPSYYHARKAVVEPSSVSDEKLVDKIDEIEDDVSSEKQSVFLTLSDDNVFKILYIKLFGDK